MTLVAVGMLAIAEEEVVRADSVCRDSGCECILLVAASGSVRQRTLLVIEGEPSSLRFT